MADHHTFRRIRNKEGLMPAIPTYFRKKCYLKFMEELDPFVEMGDKGELQTAISALGIPDTR